MPLTAWPGSRSTWPTEVPWTPTVYLLASAGSTGSAPPSGPSTCISALKALLARGL